MSGGSFLNILVPLYREVGLAVDCLLSVKFFAESNPDIKLTVWISDDSEDKIVDCVLTEVNFTSDVVIMICERSDVSSFNPAVHNWNFLLDQIPLNSYYILLHHDERLPNSYFDMGCSEVTVLALKGVSIRRSSLWSRCLTKFALSVFPEILYMINLVGPTACIVTCKKVYFNTELRWLVDVDYYVRLFRSIKSFQMCHLEVESVLNERSITSTINQSSLTMMEAERIGLNFIQLYILKFKYFLKAFFIKMKFRKDIS